jgi:hypothetical protein
MVNLHLPLGCPRETHHSVATQIFNGVTPTPFMRGCVGDHMHWDIVVYHNGAERKCQWFELMFSKPPSLLGPTPNIDDGEMLTFPKVVSQAVTSKKLCMK